MSYIVDDFGMLDDGGKVLKITISNEIASVSILTYGAILHSFTAFGRNVVVTADDIKGYVGRSNSKIIGPFANRIKKGHFVLNGKEYQLDINNKSNCSHSGSANIGNHIWNIKDHTDDSITLTTQHKAMVGGIPGNMEFAVKYMLFGSTLRISYEVTSDEDSIINPTNHAFFNLNAGNENILNHEVEMNADRYMEVDQELIPVAVSSVAGTDFDFTSYHRIGERRGGAYDHCFIFSGTPMCKVKADGFMLSVKTDRPAMQMYTGKGLVAEYCPRGEMGAFGGVALETSGYIDAVNHPEYPSAIINKGDTFTSWTEYTISKV